MVIKSKLITPKLQKNLFHRSRLELAYQQSLDYPLTMIHAGTGFGKTTALIELSGKYKQVFWYTITEPDRDPILFLAHLLSTFLPVTANLLDQLKENGIAAFSAVFTSFLNQLTLDLEEDAVLALDDFHIVSDVSDISHWIEMLIENQPPRLHLAVATRSIPDTPAIIRWRVKNMLYLIDQKQLSFNESEISQFFGEHYNFPITFEQASSIFSYSDGWVIALQMIWQRLQTSRTRNLNRILGELPATFSEVFFFLAHEVLMRQTEELQTFLLSSAVLQQMDAASCNALLDTSNSNLILQDLLDRGLFTYSVDDTTYRYQRLFQDFLLDQGRKNPEKIKDLHIKAAKYFTQIQSPEDAIFHLFASNEFLAAAQLIEQHAPQMVRNGRLRTVTKWIDSLSPAILDQFPTLWLISGEVYRLQSRFDAAIQAYQRAEQVFVSMKERLGQSQALRGQAQVYLDTIRPLKASSLLEEAVSLLEPQENPSEVASLLDQLAENKLNLGKPDEARSLHGEANMLRSEANPDSIYLEARSLLRTGYLQDAINLYEPFQTDSTQIENRPQRFHREMPLLLALIHLMLGNIDQGEEYALQGIKIGKQLDSPFVEAVGWMRLGHARQLHPHHPWRVKRLQEALNFYQRSIDLVKPFNVMRVQVEPLWGLCRYHGYLGQLQEAERFAKQAFEIAESAGDQWFVGLIYCTMGTSFTLSGKYENAREWLTNGATIFHNVRDSFGSAAINCALLYNEWYNGSQASAIELTPSLFGELKQGNYDFLLTRASHLGFQDPQPFIPILLEAYKQGIEADWIQVLLKGLDLSHTDYHPGYGLSIQTLGKFEVWRGNNLTNARDWQREKARQLFQFFINNRGKWFSRDQLTDRLWPNLDLEASNQNLKVALNALNRALEPGREPGQNPFFIQRYDALYGLNPAACVKLDVDDFIQLTSSSEPEDLQAALELYQGDYLSDGETETWSFETRERMREVYLGTAHKLAEYHLNNAHYDETMRICHAILSIDHCNEPAFRLLMRSHAFRGNQSGVHSVFQRCTTLLQEDLDVSPSNETINLYHELTK